MRGVAGGRGRTGWRRTARCRHGAPVLLNTTLKFCASAAAANSNSSCCDAAALSAQFDAMKHGVGTAERRRAQRDASLL
ncbi:unnamed protein product [Urochloa humidicola]